MKEKTEPKVVMHVEHLMSLYKSVASGQTIFEVRTGTQMLRDALESAKRCGLIKDYNLCNYTIQYP